MDSTNITRGNITHPIRRVNKKPLVKESKFQPVFEITRGQTIESVHFGAISVVDSIGSLIAEFGDPDSVAYLRSTSKPLQAISFLEHGGCKKFNLTIREIALICGSHAGTDAHMGALKSLQSKVGVVEADLLCGTHPIRHKPTWEAMQARGEEPTPNRHNCSGKHTGMLAYARLLGIPGDKTHLPYINPEHPVQKNILNEIAALCDLSPAEIKIGIDGCSVPNFALPLRNAALAFARLCEPVDMRKERADACHLITEAMTAHPYMVGGPDSFDTSLMTAGSMGIAIKIADGDARGRVRPAVALEVLRRLGGITNEELSSLDGFGPIVPIKNWRGIDVGMSKPNFKLIWHT
jgi:L-asparaginase II